MIPTLYRQRSSKFILYSCFSNCRVVANLVQLYSVTPRDFQSIKMLCRSFLAVPKLVKRNFGIAAPVLQKVNDPIQQLFLDKIREFKSKSAGGKLETSPELQKELKAELEKVAKAYGGGPGTDMTSFPQFNFPEPKIEAPLASSNQ